MPKPQTGNITHDQTVLRAEGIRQAAVAAAAIAGSQANARAADIACYQTAVASAKANNCGITTFLNALRELGVGQ
jgi:hypothetical protein